VIRASSVQTTAASDEIRPAGLECCEAAELVKALIDFFAGQGLETLDAELLAAEATQHRPVDDRSM